MDDASLMLRCSNSRMTTVIIYMVACQPRGVQKIVYC
jgi:hypothetical protein